MSVATNFSSSSNRFQVVRRLGEGGMGVVYEVDDIRRQQRVALKTFRSNGSDVLYSFKREFRTLADLSHPNLIQLYDLVIEGDDVFFTMELVDGLDVLAYCRNHDTSLAEGDRPTMPQTAGPAFDEEKLRACLVQLASGLGALHEARKLHRDIKPSNVIVTRKGRAVLLDFGLATDMEGGRGESTSGSVVGTPQYMSPEQAGAEPRLGPASDWYSVGVLLYEILTGRLPFNGPPLKILVDKQQKDPLRPRDLVPGVPRDLDDLCMALMSRDARDRPCAEGVLRLLGRQPAVATSTSSSHGSARTAFTGREDELAKLQASYEALGSRTAGAVVVQSPSGMGKSTLIRQFLRGLEQNCEPIVVLEGRCYEREDIPYKAIDSLIDGFSQYWRQLPRDRAAELLPRDANYLPRLFPVLGRVPAVADSPRMPDIPDPQELQRRAFGALRDLLQRLADRKRVVLFIDDMQWVDADTVRLLADVLRPPDTPAVLLVVSARDQGGDLLESLLQRLDIAIERVELGPLSAIDARRLAEQILPDAESAVVSRVAQESEGSPFFLGELGRYLQSVDDVDLDSVRLDNVLAKRRDTLSDASRTVLELVSLAGQPIARRVVGRAAGLSFDELTREARGLRAASFIRSAGAGSEQLSPYHDRIREVVAADLPEDRRARHHRNLALALAEFDGSDELLAYHWGNAGEPGRSAEHAELAARDSVARLDFDRAAELFRLALSSGTHTCQAQRRLHLCLADALSHAGRSADAARAYAAAADDNDRNQRLDMRRRAAEELLRGGYIDDGLQALGTVLQEIDQELSATPRQALTALLARRAWLGVRGLRFKERPVSAIAPDDLMRVDVFWSASSGLAMVHHLRGHEYQSRHMLAALKIGEPARLAKAFALEAAYQAGQAKRRSAYGLLERAQALAEKTQDPYTLSILRGVEGLIAFYSDSDWASAYDKLSEAETMVRARHSSGGWELDTLQYFLCLTMYYQGQLRELCRRVPAYLREAERRGDRFAEVGLRSSFNFVSLVRDDVAAAQRDIDYAEAAWGQSRDGFVSQTVQMLVAKCQLAMYTDEPAHALELMSAADKPLRKSMLLRAPWVRVTVDFLHGRVLLAAADKLPLNSSRRKVLGKQARRLARRALRSPLPLGVAYGHLIAAGLAQLNADRAAAEASLRAAIAALDAIGSELLAQIARRRLGQLLGDGEMVHASDGWLTSEGVEKPERWAQMLLPWSEQDR